MSDTDKIIQNWLLEFDKLHRSQHTKVSSGVQFVFFENEWMNIDCFLKKKAELFNAEQT